MIRIFLFALCTIVLISWKSTVVYFSKSETKEVKIFSGKFNVPAQWKTKPFGHTILLFTGDDTLRFTEGWMYQSLPVLMTEFTALPHDTIVVKMNREVRAYNDSLVKNDPRVLTLCEDQFLSADSTYHLACILPCKDVPGTFSMQIFTDDQKHLLAMHSGMMSAKHAKEILEVMKTFRFSN
jgi:hypothetical protein